MNNRGQALLEFALILPLLILLLMGIIEFGRIFNAYIVLNHLSREGARYAATGESYTTIHDMITDGAAVLGAGSLQITISPAQSHLTRGNPVTVKLEFDLPLFIPLINNLLSNPMHLTAETTMRVE